MTRAGALARRAGRRTWGHERPAAARVGDGVFAGVYDRGMAASEREGLGALRAELLAGAQGRVLELGAGTGANLAHYPAGLDTLMLIEPEHPMARRLRPRAAAAPQLTEVLEAPAGALPVPDATVDTVVSTLVLCTVPDVDAALTEVRRVLAPGGRLLFLERVHRRGSRPRAPAGPWNPLQRRIAHGCNVNRPTPDLIARAGFTLHDVRRQHFPKGPSVGASRSCSGARRRERAVGGARCTSSGSAGPA